MSQFIDSSGKVRRLGNNPGPLRFHWAPYGSTDDEEIIDESRWAELIGQDTGPDDPHCPPPHQQDGIGMCNCSATAAAIESCRMQEGLPYASLSGGDLYHRISGGQDQGSLLEDGVREATANGIASVAMVPYLDWQRGHGDAAVLDRKRFVVLKAKICPTFKHCMSAVLKGRKLISGIMWYGNYDPDRQGWLPLPRGQAGGHAIFGYKATMRNGVYGIWHQNSWGDWGPLHGRFVIPEPAYAGQVGGWWSVSSTVVEGGDIPAPKF